MSLENFTTKLKNVIIDLSYNNNHYLDDVSFNISTIINYITNDPELEQELEYYDNKLKSCINTIYNKLENTGKHYTNLSLLKNNVDISDNTTYENYETKRENDDTFYDNFQNNKGSGKEALNDDLKTKIEAKRNNNSLNYCTNMLGNYIGYFGLSTGQFNSSTTFYYMNLKPTNKLTTISGSEMETNTKAKASYEYTVNNVTIKILLEILTLNQCPYFYSYSFKGNVCYCPIFQVVNGVIASSELFPDNTYLQFTYSSSNDLTNNNNITSNQTPKWSWVRIYENEENQGDTNFGNTNPNSYKSAYLYYVYTNDSNGPQTNFLFPSNLPDYCPDGIILPWTITLCDNNGTVYTLNATQGASNFYEQLFSTAQNISGVISNAVYNKLGYYPSNL